MARVPELNVTEIPLPWKHPFGLVVGYEYPADRPNVVDVVFDSGLKAAETKTSMYAQRQNGVWDIARFVPMRYRMVIR